MGFEADWSDAAALESKGQLDSADAVYRRVLESDQTQAFAHYRRSLLAQRRGAYRAALEFAVVGTEVALRAGRFRVLPYLTQRLLVLDQRQQVVQAIEGLDWRHPMILQQAAVYSQQLWLAEAHGLALDRVEWVLGRVPGSAILHYSHGMVLRFLGQGDAAATAFERCIAIDPGMADAHWALSTQKPAVPLGSRIDRLRSALAKVGERQLEYAQFQYALFRELDDAGDLPRAWHALCAGMNCMRHRGAYDAASETMALQTLERDLSMAPVTTSLSCETRTPVFIFGLPRSGTTLLDRMLGRHPAIASGGELGTFLESMNWAADGYFDAPPRPAMLPSRATLDLAAVGSRYRVRTAHLYQQHSHLIDKHPANVFNADLIAGALPEARMVCVLREPMDSCFSNLKELFTGAAYAYSYDLEDVVGHYLGFAGWVRALKGALGQRLCIVRYEDLVREPEASCRRILRHCGLDYDAQCLDVEGNASPVSTASSVQVRRGIHTEGLGAWKRYAHFLSPVESRLESAIRDL